MNLLLVDLPRLEGPVQQLLQLIGPAQPGLLQLSQPLGRLLQHRLDQFLQSLPGLVRRFAEQHPRTGQQVIRLLPLLHHPAQRRPLQAVTLLAPVIPRHVGQQLAVVGLQLLGEQAAAVEGMLAQHALAPAVNGRDRCLIHPLGGDIQASGARGMIFLGIIGQQGLQDGVRIIQLPTEGLGRLHQPRPNAITQLAGGSVGKGDHKNFRRQQLAVEAGPIIAMAQDQAQIQRGNGEGLAGPGTGLDQAAAA